MFGFNRDKSKADKGDTGQPDEQKPGLFTRLKNGLRKTRRGITAGLAGMVVGKKQIDDELLEELETRLLTADMGVEASQAVINNLTDRLKRKQLKDAQALFAALRENMLAILQPCEKNLAVADKQPFVVLMVGVNGAGKTTTIGKLAKKLQNEGKSVMLAAGDTFRAAAVEQLQAWGDRNKIPVVAHHSKADPAAVIYDAMQSAHAKKVNVLLADTAGRLHTQSNLMEELSKVKRVAAKFDPDAPHEVVLVLDASIGQNAINQAKQFHQAMGISGIVLTKMDGTAKGGVIFAIAKQLRLPIYFIGIGESIDDLRAFNAEQFVDAILSQEDDTDSEPT